MARAAEAGARRFTVDEYYRMGETGILGPEDHVELIYGVVRQMSPINRPHVVATTQIRRLLDRGLSGRASVYEQSPHRLDALDSVPEPDLAVCSNPDVAAYGTDGTRLLLAIEVSDSSLRYDLGVKAELYARAGIPEYWVVDLVHEVLVVFRDPRDGRYGSKETFASDSHITPLSWPDFDADVSVFFPRG